MGRTYLVGVCARNEGSPNNPIGIYVWRSDDAGLTWGDPVQVAVIPADPQLFLDKPHITVNTNTGYVYVTYLRYDGTQGHENQTVAFVSRSTNGGVTFSSNPVAVVTGVIGAPQVAANTSNNNIYLVWADYNANAIRVATSTDGGLTFPAQNWNSKGARNALIGPCGNGCIPILRSNIRAYSVPIARYNAAAHVLGVVWHEREAGTSGNPAITDTAYAYYDGAQWQPATPIRLNGAATGTDNFQPALDSDLHGNVYFVWYDTNYDATGRRYKTAWAYTTYTGGFISGIVIAGFQSDPIGAHNVLASIGDYQDIVSVPNGASGRFLHAWVGVPTSTLQDDIYFWDHYE